jgi:hypothetical protein
VAVVSGRHVTLSWQLFADAGVSGFNVEAGSASGLSNLAVVTVAGAERVISLLAPPGQYFVRVRTRNECAVGPPSNEVVVTVF